MPDESAQDTTSVSERRCLGKLREEPIESFANSLLFCLVAEQLDGERGTGIESGSCDLNSGSAIKALTKTQFPTAEPSPVITARPSASATPMPVTDAEVVGIFQAFFAERASSNVLYAKAVTSVTFVDGVVSVTFGAAAARVDQATFDSLAATMNFPSFVASPIAFSDDVGNRVRPLVTLIETVRTDGSSLGTLDHAGILALNGLSE